MSVVLIHFDSDGPIGLWREKEDGSLESYYLPNVSKTWKNRGTSIMKSKGEYSTFDEYFERLCGHSAYIDSFGITQSGPTDPLESIMYKLKREQVRE